MVAALFLIGRRLEDPSLIDDLLNIENRPGKPQVFAQNEFHIFNFYHFVFRIPKLLLCMERPTGSVCE